MTLRARLALALGLLAAVAAALVAVAGYRATADRLYAQLDSTLASQASRLADPDGRYASLICNQLKNAPVTDGNEDSGELADLTGTEVQCLDAAGVPYASTESTALPVSGAARALAASGRSAVSYASDGDQRIMTVALTGGGAVQLTRDLDDVHAVLDSLRVRFALLGLAVTALAMAAGWFLARRFTRPIVTLTAATEQIAGSGALDVDIPAGGSGTETDRLSRSFATMVDALRTSRARQQALVQDAGHELRTPLTAMRTNIDVLRRHPDLDPAQRAQVLADVGAELRELTLLTDELITLAMEDADSEEPVPVDLADLARRAAARAGRRSGRTVEVDAESSVVVGRPRLLLRVLDNLLDNAVKFDPSQLPIAVTVRSGQVTVRDHGPGIRPEDRSRVFDRFYRALPSRTQPGSGLGLAIVRDAVLAHDGEVSVTNHPDGGAVFTVTLPLAQVPADSQDALTE
jgi:two-component system, OmpR family, sensor histidine kinase MprB